MTGLNQACGLNSMTIITNHPEIKRLNTIGILGGMSSEATGEYYRLINQKVKESEGAYNIAEILINSVNFANIERFVRTDNWDDAGNYLAHKAKSLEDAGASCIFLATNTMHKVRDSIKEATSIPFIDIFETVCTEIKTQGKTKVGILGTYPVMSDHFYIDAYEKNGIELVSPDEADKKEIDRIIFDELTQNKFLDSSKAFYQHVMQKLIDNGAEGVILGCTEIKMLINQKDVTDIPLFDTTDLHCDMAAKICTGEIKL